MLSQRKWLFTPTNLGRRANRGLKVEETVSDSNRAIGLSLALVETSCGTLICFLLRFSRRFGVTISKGNPITVYANWCRPPIGIWNRFGFSAVLIGRTAVYLDKPFELEPTTFRVAVPVHRE